MMNRTKMTKILQSHKDVTQIANQHSVAQHGAIHLNTVPTNFQPHLNQLYQQTKGQNDIREAL